MGPTGYLDGTFLYLLDTWMVLAVYLCDTFWFILMFSYLSCTQWVFPQYLPGIYMCVKVSFLVLTMCKKQVSTNKVS